MKLNGYRASHRNRWLLLSERILSIREFILFEYYLDSMDFDRTHGEKFATFEVFLDEIAPLFDKEVETVKGWHDGLVNKGFVKIADSKRSLYTIKSPLRYVGGGKWGGKASLFAEDEKNQTKEFILENIIFFQPEGEKIRLKSEEKVDISENSVKNSLSSSKGESIVSSPVGSKKIVVIKQEVRSDAEYRKIYEDDGCLGLSPDDMKLADQILNSLSNH